MSGIASHTLVLEPKPWKGVSSSDGALPICPLSADSAPGCTADAAGSGVGDGKSSTKTRLGGGTSRSFSHGKMGGGLSSTFGLLLGTSYHMSFGGSGYAAGAWKSSLLSLNSYCSPGLKLAASGLDSAGGAELCRVRYSAFLSCLLDHLPRCIPLHPRSGEPALL